ncbi:SMP-30/gluconolactonase/LRE family protein [Rheinheimera soli]|uniref:Sugar lactone lactonase YvrE n=1 Tax=Rheinheimera soli TaxID=443616 RepID=A0ABU1W3S1_9GAMM|nr:SMP-30/gluconolactonase/LRE family protein [Rheinheimera soli]MDR7122363.1 sugar lactone lactonase YvrE [Rheinheimera soli]
MSDFTLLHSIPLKNKLGEGIIWHGATQSVWWTDIHGRFLYQLFWPSLQLNSFPLPERISCFALLNAHDPMRADYSMLVAFESGFALYQPQTQNIFWLVKPEPHLSGNRMNDGRIDHQGRFWAGTMKEQDQGQHGTLYRLDQQGCDAVITGLQIPNSLCWNKSSSIMYHADSPTGEIYSYRFDSTKGSVGQPQLFATVPKGAEPDGAVIDAEDHLLCALWGGAAIARFSPSGQQTALHALPVNQPTCLAFGGPDLNLLFVTTARQGLTEEQLNAEPDAGSLLIYQSPYQGLPESELAVLDWTAIQKSGGCDVEAG